MAISATFRFIIRNLQAQQLLPTGGSLLEIGEANWYGAIDEDSLAREYTVLIPDVEQRNKVLAKSFEIIRKREHGALFDLVKVFYEHFLAPSHREAIDFEGGPDAHRFDLNNPVKLDRQFDVVMNHGTAEHIFRIAQVFETMHQYTLPGGLMFHECPFTGWLDHGFYNVNPTLFYDVKAANGYAMLGLFTEDLKTSRLIQLVNRDDAHQLAKEGKLPQNAILLAVFRKGLEERPFAVPIQGYYAKTLSTEGTAAWKDLR